MPNFIFELTGKKYFYIASADKSIQTSKLTFVAEVQSRCNIEIKDKGRLLIGDMTIYENADSGSKNALGKIFYVEGSEESHTFSVHAYLPTAAFHHLLKTNEESASIYLTFSTSFEALQADESGVSYGHGTGEVVWDVEKESAVTADSITLAVIYKAAPQPTSIQNSDFTKEEIVEKATAFATEKLDEIINLLSVGNKNLLHADFCQLRESSLSTKLNPTARVDTAHEHLLNRIFWAIVVVGGLMAINFLSINMH